MHDHDSKWVTDQLCRLPTPAVRQALLKKYNEIYLFAYNAEPLSHRKTGKARFQANNGLRVYINSICPVVSPMR